MNAPFVKSTVPFRRSIEVRLSGSTSAEVELEDDHHHFLVRILSDGEIIVGATGKAIRNPWTMCPRAAEELRLIVGYPIAADPTAVLAYADIRQQCTHMFDLAGMGVAGLARGGPGLRRYDMAVLEVASDFWQAELRRDDGLSLHWQAGLGELTGPDELAGLSLKRPFPVWARAYFPGDQFEAALALRRALFVGKYRHRHNLDDRETAAEGANMGGCFVLQPERAPLAHRHKGATRSFPLTGPGPLIAPDT